MCLAPSRLICKRIWLIKRDHLLTGLEFLYQILTQLRKLLDAILSLVMKMAVMLDLKCSKADAWAKCQSNRAWVWTNPSQKLINSPACRHCQTWLRQQKMLRMKSNKALSSGTPSSKAKRIFLYLKALVGATVINTQLMTKIQLIR
jgi:hypothetical protein